MSWFQLYYWQIRAPFDQTEGRIFPKEVEEIYDDVLKAVRPHLTLAKSIEDAASSVKSLESKILNSIQSKAPEIWEQTHAYSDAKAETAGLDTITEFEEDNSVSDPEVSMESGSDEEDFNPDDSESEFNSEDEDDMDEEDIDSDDREVEVVTKKRQPKFIACQEDDDFLSNFDKMVNENINESRSNAIPRGQQKSIAVPMVNKAKSSKVDMGCLFDVFLNITFCRSHSNSRRGFRPSSVFRSVAQRSQTDVQELLSSDRLRHCQEFAETRERRPRGEGTRQTVDAENQRTPRRRRHECYHCFGKISIKRIHFFFPGNCNSTLYFRCKDRD